MTALLTRLFEQVVAVDNRAAEAARLGAIHGLVRGAQQTGQRIGMLRVEGEADGSGAYELFLADQVGLFQRLSQALGQLPGHLAADVGDQCDELVATAATDDIAGPQTAFQTAHRDGQQLVADFVSAAVVYLLEVVQIDEDQRAGRIVRTVLQAAGGRVFEAALIEDAGQWI